MFKITQSVTGGGILDDENADWLVAERERSSIFGT
jgi:hypothetical protein